MTIEDLKSTLTRKEGVVIEYKTADIKPTSTDINGHQRTTNGQQTDNKRTINHPQTIHKPSRNEQIVFN